MAKRLAVLVFAGALLCGGSVAALDAMTRRAESRMSDMVTVFVDRNGRILRVESSTGTLVAQRAELARRLR